MSRSQRAKIVSVILAGGNANRMDGIAKGTLRIAKGLSIVERLISELNLAGIKEVIISANNVAAYEVFGKEIIPDIRTDVGPLAGIEAGLQYFTGRCDAVMFLPCDLPCITVKQILALKDSFIASQNLVVFAQTSEFFYQPLCVVVHNELANDISAAIEAGVRKPLDLWFKLNEKTVFFESEEPFFNVNSPEDLQVLRKSTSQFFFECKDK